MKAFSTPRSTLLRTQPQGLVIPSASRSAARALTFCYIPSYAGRDLVSLVPSVLDSGFTYKTTRAGRAFSFNGSTDGFTTQAYAATQAPYSCIFLAVPTSTAGFNLLTAAGTGVAYAWQIQRNGTSWIHYHYTNTDVPISSATAVAGQLAHIAVTWDGGTTRLYIDGVLRDSNAAIASSRNRTVSQIGEYNFGAKYGWDGEIAMAALWNGYALSANEVSENFVNPWSLFEPPRRTVYFDAAAAAAAQARSAGYVIG